MRIVVTGSKGMLGYDLVQRLKRNHDVIGIDIDDIDIVQRDVIDYLLKVKPNFIYHLAAYTDVDKAETEREKAYDVNVNGIRNIVTVSKELDVPLAFISTDYVFDGSKKTPYTEYDTPNPINYYGETKRDAEEIVTKTLNKFFITRTSWLFGKNGKNFVKTIISLAQKKKVIEVVDDQFSSPTYTFDLSVSLEMFLQSEQFGVYHITNSGVCSWFDFAEKIIAISGNKTSIVPIKTDDLKRPARRPRNSILDNILFEKRFNYRMPNWENALRRYLSEGRREV